VAPSPGAATWLVSDVLEPERACFGWRRRTLETLASEVALPVLARAEEVPVRRLGLEALCARVVHALAAADGLGRFSSLSRRPGFVRALTSSLDELRLAGIGEQGLAPHDPEMARILGAYVASLSEAKLADRARVFEAATEKTKSGAVAELGAALVMLDVPLVHAREAEFAIQLGATAAKACVTVPLGDACTREAWLRACAERIEERTVEPEDEGELSRLQRRLFAEPPPRVEAAAQRSVVAKQVAKPPAAALRQQVAQLTLDWNDAPSIAAEDAPPASVPSAESGVRFASSPGESRECVEVARSILRAAESGIAFDRMAVAVRAVENYRAVLEEALARAKIPAHFADGVRRPAPEGRAFNALLTCAAEGLSARSFAEYLSIGVMPQAAASDAPAEDGAGAASVPLVSPRRWERLILDASVVGGLDRWRRRLGGLRVGLRIRAAAARDDDVARERALQEIAQLEGLERFAFPVLDALAALPRAGTWREWLAALERLAQLSLRDPSAVCDTLAELAPLGPVGPVTLADVRRLLTPRLRSVIVPSTGTGAGQVFVGSIDELRGRSFARVFVVGLAEKVFPARIGEDPLLPDRIRSALTPAPVLTAERIARERLALRLAVGAASEGVVLSYSRLDLEHGRPRVPSFYGLEALQAICGELPAFDELARRADPGAAPRLGWPAPEDPDRAIDDAEYDVAILGRCRSGSEPNVGAARYLMQANPHLARALRFRARRWQLQRFVAADGFVVTTDAARELLPAHALVRRAHSASTLAQFTACPYKFYLNALMRLSEPERIAEVDELDPRERGILFHAVQREVVLALQADELLPLTEANLPRARELLQRCLEIELARAREAYAPAIERVFDAALGSLRSDLEGWLRALAQDDEWSPLHAELEFGFAHRNLPDRAASRAAVSIEPGLLLSGAIDLVEEHTESRATGARVLRATDHKTGAVPGKLGVTQGGTVLQPLLYALALERLFPGATVRGGRLHFCTSRGRFEVQDVPLTARARETGERLIRAISSMLEAGFLPAAPDREACENCSYRVICGPYEEERVAQVKAKESFRLAPLFQIRDLP
jgi:ATP-dependent helicase/nuclease subunit B